jgi:hypothetical protein
MSNPAFKRAMKPKRKTNKWISSAFPSGDGIRTYTTKRISKSRTISDGRYMGCAQSALLLSSSELLKFYILKGYGDLTLPTKWNARSPTLAPVSRQCNIAWITGQLDILLNRLARHRQSSKKQIKMCQAHIKRMTISLLQELTSSVLPGPRWYGQVGGCRLKSELFKCSIGM